MVRRRRPFGIGVKKLSRLIYYSVAPYFIAFEEIRGAWIVKSS